MKDEDKSKEQLLTELRHLRQQITELEISNAERRRSEKALGESEETFRAIANYTSDVEAWFGTDGRLRWINPSVERILGYTPAECLVMPDFPLPLIHPEDAARVVEELSEAHRGGRGDHQEFRFVHKGGTVRWGAVSWDPIFDQHGQSLGHRSSVRDISRSKRAEEALQRSMETACQLAKENEIIAEIGRIISSSLDIEEVYGRFAEEVKKIISFDRIVITIINPEDHTATVIYVSGIEVAGRNKGEAYPLAGSITEEVRRTRSSLFLQAEDPKEIREALERSPSLKFNFQNGIRSMISGPLISKDEVIGVLHLRSTKPNAYSEKDLRIIERVGNRIAGAIANAQLFAERNKAEEALRRSEEKYRKVCNYAPLGFVVWGVDYRILEWNKQAEEMFGWAHDEAVGKNFFDLIISEKGRQRVKGIVEDLMRGKIERHIIHENVKKNGEPIWCEWNNAVFWDSEGRAVGVISLALDITARKQTEEMLQKMEQEYRMLAENSPDLIARFDTCLRHLYVNSAAARAGKLSASEYVGLTITESGVSEPVATMWDQRIRQVLRTGKMGEVEDAFPTPEGIRFFHTRLVPELTSDGSVCSVLSVARDITERKRAEEALRENEQKYRSLFDGSRDAVYITTREGQFVDFNNAILDLFGYTKDEMMRLNTKNLYAHPKNRLRFQREIEKKGSVREYEVEFSKKDGTKIYCLLTSSLRQSKDGKILGYHGVIRDITERRQWEDHLNNSREQLRALAARLQVVREEERTQIARQIHDELGQQLTGFKMDLSWLSKKLPKTNKSLGNKTESMMKLIDEAIQSVRKISSELRPGILDDLGLVAAIEWQAQDFQKRSGIKCELKLNLKEIDLDRNLSTAVFRIFQETLTNVIRHAKATRVKTTLVKKNGKLELKVEDNGKGIGQNKIFDSKSLGLVGMRERILPWQGQIDIHGIRGQGTTVRVIIPLK